MPRSKKVSASVYKEPVTVHVAKASNGYVVRSYRDTGRMVEVVYTHKEAKEIEKRILGK